MEHPVPVLCQGNKGTLPTSLPWVLGLLASTKLTAIAAVPIEGA